MANPLVVEQSQVVPVGVDEAFRGTLPMPLPILFRRWHGPIPPIKAVLDQVGEWSTTGQTRSVTLVGGGSMREELTHVEPPRSFGYTLTDVKGPMSALVSRIEGQWSFAAVGTGTEVTWRWTVHPRSVLAAPALPAFGWLWHGYARKALRELSVLLVPTPAV